MEELEELVNDAPPHQSAVQSRTWSPRVALVACRGGEGPDMLWCDRSSSCSNGRSQSAILHTLRRERRSQVQPPSPLLHPRLVTVHQMTGANALARSSLNPKFNSAPPVS